MNSNRIATTRFSNPSSRRRYRDGWPGEDQCSDQHFNGLQCGGCSFFAPLNEDWGLCCFKKSRHFLETVIEHFTCPQYQHESWTSHSFKDQSHD